MAKRRSRPADYIPRPPNQWIIYRAVKSKELKEKNVPVASKAVSLMWEAEPSSVKQHYEELAAAAKLEHTLMYPEYKYRPRQKKDKILDANSGTQKPNAKAKGTRSARGAELYEHIPLDLDTDQSADAFSSTTETFVSEAFGSQNMVAFPSSADTTPELPQGGDDFQSNRSGSDSRPVALNPHWAVVGPSNMGTFIAEASESQTSHQQWPSMPDIATAVPQVEQFPDQRMENYSGHHAKTVAFDNQAVASPSTMYSLVAEASESQIPQASEQYYHTPTHSVQQYEQYLDPRLFQYSAQEDQPLDFSNQAVADPSAMHFLVTDASGLQTPPASQYYYTPAPATQQDEQYVDPGLFQYSSQEDKPVDFGNQTVSGPSTMHSFVAEASGPQNIQGSQYSFDNDKTTMPQPTTQFVFDPRPNNYSGMQSQSMTFETQAIEGVPQKMDSLLPLGPSYAQAEADSLNALNQQKVVVVDDELDFGDLGLDEHNPFEALFDFGRLGLNEDSPFGDTSFELTAPQADDNLNVRAGEVVPAVLGQRYSNY